MLGLTGDLLEIYLQDHLAGAMGGVQLAQRMYGQNKGTEFGEFLGRLAQDIEEDRQDLKAIMQRLGVSADPMKVAGAWAAEKAGRLKFNGSLLNYSPLSRVIEFEGLIMGVNGKLSLWNSLRAVASTDSRLDAEDLDRLIARAQEQIAGLREHHLMAAEAAFLSSAGAPA